MSRSLSFFLLVALGVAMPLFGQGASVDFDGAWDRKNEGYSVFVNVEATQTSTSELTLTGTVPSVVTAIYPLNNGFLCDPITNGHYTCRLGSTTQYARYQVAFFITNPPGAPTTVYNTSAQLSRDGVTGTLKSVSLTAYGRIDLASAVTGPSTIVAGSTATYDVTVTNISTNTVVAPWQIYGNTVDTASSGAVFTQITADPGILCNIDYPASYSTCNVGDLAPGASKTVHMTVKAAANLAAPVKVGINASASYSPSPEKELSNNGAMATSSITYATDLAVAGSAPASASNGGDVPVSWTISNNGVSDASSVVFDTTLPAAATFLSLQQTGFTCSAPAIGATGAIHCTAPSLGAAAQRTITVTMRPTAAGTMTNSATVSNARTDTSSTNNSASVSTTISEATSAHADVSITASSSAPRVRTNGDFGITLNVANAGPDTASSIVVTETLASGFVATSLPSACSGTSVVTCSIATLASGASASFALQVRTGGTAGSFTSTAAITTPNDTTANNNSASVATTVVSSLNLQLRVSASPKFALPGSNVVWTFSPSASGSTSEAITLTDVVPSGMSVVKLPSNCSGTSTITCSVQLPSSVAITLALPATPGTYSNSATLTSIIDSDPSDNSASASVVARTGTDASITGHAYFSSVPGGELMSFELDLENEGPAVVDPMSIAITFPDGSESMTDFTNCAHAGLTVTCTMGAFGAGTRHINLSALAPLVPGTYAATVRIIAPGDLDPSNDSISIPITVTTPPETDIEVSSIAPFSVGVGELFNIDAVVKIKSGRRPHQVVLTNTIPAGTTLESIYGPCEVHGTDVVCSFGSMVNGSSFLYEDQVEFTLRAPLTPGSVTNRMSVTSFNDPNPANDSATQVVQVIAAPLPNVAATMNEGSIGTTTGAPFGFGAYFRNTGDSAIGNTEMQIVLPAGAVVRSVSPSNACSITGTTINCHFSFAAHQSVTVTVEATAPATVGSYTVTSKLLTPDGDPRDDQATRTLTVATPDYTTDVAVHITGTHNANRGDDVISIISITNNGGGDARNLTLTVHLPEGFGFRSLSVIGAPLTCQTPAVGSSSGEIRCVAATFGQTQSSLTLVTRVANDAPSSVTTSIYISNEITDPSYTNNSDSLQTVISNASVSAPDLSVTITPLTDVMAGSAATVQTNVTNRGNAVSGAITVMYAVDHGVIAGTSGAQCVASGSTATCTIASLAPGASVPIALVVNTSPIAGPTRVSMTATTSGDDDSTTATIVTAAPRRRPVR